MRAGVARVVAAMRRSRIREVDGRGLAAAPGGGRGRHGGRPRGRGAGAQSRVPLRGDGGPAARHAQGGHDARRQDRRGRRDVAVDHGRGRAARRPPAPRSPRTRSSWASARCWRTIPSSRCGTRSCPRRSRSGSSSTAGSASRATPASSARAIPRARSSPASRPAPAGPAAALRAPRRPGPRASGRETGRVDLRALLEALRALDVIAVLVEGGGELGGALARPGSSTAWPSSWRPGCSAGASAPGPLGGRGRSLKDALALVDVVTRRLGEDLLVEADVRALGHVHGDRRGARPGRQTRDRGATGGGSTVAVPDDPGWRLGLGASVAVSGVCLTVVDAPAGTARVRSRGGDARADDPRRPRGRGPGEPRAATALRRAARRPPGPGPRRRRGPGRGGPAGGRGRAARRGGARAACARS